MEKKEENKLEAIKKKDNCFVVIDQLKLPLHYEKFEIKNTEEAWKAIKSMQVRGAPLISVVGIEGIKYELLSLRHTFTQKTQLKEFLEQKTKYILTSRPTAVSLANDIKTLMEDFSKNYESATVQQLIDNFAKIVNKIFVEYEDCCEKMAINGANHIEKIIPNKQKYKVLTICNTGKLATPGRGTALGIVRELHKRGKLEQLYIPETRPYNQGIRLTAFEAVEDNLPATLITDSMIGFLMQTQQIDFALVGADRVAKNGDVANKVGTFGLSVLANYFKIPVFSVCPISTIDFNLEDGSKIVIEQRPKEELTKVQNIQLAPDKINVWNPSFDITPHYLLKAVLTEIGPYPFNK